MVQPIMLHTSKDALPENLLYCRVGNCERKLNPSLLIVFHTETAKLLE